MDIRKELPLLSELGLVDREIHALEARVKLLPEKSDILKAKAAELNSKLAELVSEQDAINSAKRKLERDIQDERAHLRQWEARADRIVGERDYDALMSEIKGQKRKIVEIENEVLDHMQGLEDVEKKVNSTKAKADEANKKADAEYAVVAEELSGCELSLSTKKEIKAGLLGKIAPQIKSKYTRIAERRAGLGISLVSGPVCAACRRTLPHELYNKVIRLEVIESCPACNRILVPDIADTVEA